MIVELVSLVILWINALPPSPYVGGNLIPRHIITVLTIDYTKHFHLHFGEYAQVHESHHNTMQEQTTGFISLQPTGNYQGGYFFMSLATSQILNRKIFTPLPLPQDVINGVHRLARHNPKGIDIRDRYRRPFLDPDDRANDDDDNSTYAPSDDNNSNNEDYSDNNQSDHDKNANLHLPPDQ